ncbi:lysophospholipid acyltransferase family protein [Chloroflexota bacterium]
MTDNQKSPFRFVEETIYKTLTTAPWYIMSFIFRIIYGFRMENRERIPSDGPFILILKEPSLAGMFTSGYISITVIQPLLFKENPTPVISFMQDLLFHFAYFNIMQSMADRYGWKQQVRALVPHGGSGRIAMGLLDALHILREGGVVIMNPEGDARWDGRAMPIGNSTAWIGLHSAAPIVPAVATIGTYEVWPVWTLRPFLHGSFSIKVGEPFKLTETPLETVTDEEMDAASERIRVIYEELAYGEGGVDAWVGPVTRNGKPVDEPVQLRPAQDLVPADQWNHNPNRTAVVRRGVTLLLWRCPVCHTNDALIHRHPMFRTQTVSCQACDTVWELRSLMGNDLRMQVMKGAPELIGLDMPLSTWFEKMKIGFQPAPIHITGVDLIPGEEVYLEVADVPLEPHKPSFLFENWNEREAPKSQPPAQQIVGDWDSIGEGRLLLTSHRLLWKSPQRELDFYWSSISSVHNFAINTLGIGYVSARYRFPLQGDLGLKWLTYAGTLAQRTAEQNGHKVIVAPY